MEINLFLAAGFVLALVGILGGTIWYRAHKRKLRKCTCRLKQGGVCCCDPERIGKIYPILQPHGTHPSIDGVKVLAVVFTRCRSTGTVQLAKWEEKYVGRISRRWKMWTEPESYDSSLVLFLHVADAVTVVQLMEKIQLPNGKDATSIYANITEIPKGTPETLERVLKVIFRRRRSRGDKAGTGSLAPMRHEPLAAG